MKKLLQLKTMLLLCALIVGSGSVWADTLTEGFETKATSTTYNSTVTITTSESDCGIAWSIYYGTVSTTGKISESNSAHMRWYSSAKTNYPYIKTTTAVDDLSKIEFKAKTGSTNVKMDVSYSADGDNWTVGTTHTFTDANIAEDVSLDIPAGNKYVKFGVNPSSTAPSSGNFNLIVDDVVFTTKTPTTTTINSAGINKSDRKGGAAAGSLTASVKAGEDAVLGATVTWESDDENVATVDAGGAVTLIKAGSTTIKAKYAGDATYASSEGTYILTVTDTRDAAGLEFAPNAQTINVGQTHAAFSLTNPNNLTVTYSSNNTGVATVNKDTGEVEGVHAGTAMIKASFAGDDNYKAGEDSYTLIVNENAAVNPEGEGLGGGYVLVTDASTLSEGDNLIIVSSADGDAYALGTNGTNNRTGVSIEVDNGSITTIGNTVQVITLEGTTGAWYFNVGTDQYLYNASTSNKSYFKTTDMETAGNKAKAAISIDSSTGVATVVFSADYRNNLRFNYNNGSPLFNCYGSGQDDIYIFRLNEATSFDIKIGNAGWRTLVSAQDVASLPTDLKAYTVTEIGKTSVTLTNVTAIAKNTPYLLEGDEGTYSMTIASDAVAAPEDNKLQISDEFTTNGVYVLANKVIHGVGFYKWDGGLLGAGRVYLPAPESGDAREFISFDSEATGIENVNREVKDFLNGEFFNLNGQRVAQPTKGLYIVNGKKVIIK